MPKLSVILPYFNAEKTIARAINSIINQTFSDFECLLIDNNSTDKSTEIVKNITKGDLRFKLYHEDKQGVVFASNLGSELAKGEYIARMDADDECFPNRFLSQINFLDMHKSYGAVAGMVEFVGDMTKSKGFADYVNWVNSVDTYDKIFKKRFIELPIINPSAMWRASVGREHGMYIESELPEDYEMWLRWLQRGVEIGKVNEYALKWYDSETRLTRTDTRYSNEAFYKAKSPFIAKQIKAIKKEKIGVWGASRTSRQRAKLLENYGIEICCYIDITEKRIISEKILFYKDLKPSKDLIILVYVRQSKIRQRVQNYLEKLGYIEGISYYLVS